MDIRKIANKLKQSSGAVYRVQNNRNGDTFEVTGRNPEDALVEALDMLGWNMSDEPIDEIEV